MALDSAPKRVLKHPPGTRKGDDMPMRIHKCLPVFAIATMLSLAPFAPAQAQGGLCGQRDQVIAQLKGVHGESRQSVGLQRNARVMETYANPETGTWTIIVSSPTGVACLVAAGEAFQADELTTVGSAKDDPA